MRRNENYQRKLLDGADRRATRPDVVPYRCDGRRKGTAESDYVAPCGWLVVYLSTSRFRIYLFAQDRCMHRGFVLTRSRYTNERCNAIGITRCNIACVCVSRNDRGLLENISSGSSRQDMLKMRKKHPPKHSLLGR